MSGGAVGEKDRARLLKGAGINLVGALGKFLSPVYLILANQIFGPSAFGLYSLTLAPLDMLSNFVVTGFKDAVERFAARDPDETEASDAVYSLIWNCLVWVMGMAVIAILILATVGKPLVEYAWHRPELYKVLLLFTTNIPLIGIMGILLTACRALMIMHPDVIASSFLVPATMIAASFGLHPYVPNVYGLVLAFTAGNVVGVAVSVYYFTRYYSLRRLWAARKVPCREKLAQFAVPQSLNMMLTMATWNLDVMMLGGFVGDAQIGFYRTAAEIARSLTQLRYVFSAVYSPLVARYAREKNVAAMQESFSVISRWVLAVAAPVTVLVFLYRSEILWVFNPAYNQDALFLSLLLVGPLLNAATGLTGNILVMAGFPLYNLMNGLLLTAVNGCLNYFLIPHWDLAGAAFATMIAQLGVGFLQIVEVRALVGVRVEWFKFGRATIGALLAFCAALGVHHLAAPWPVVALVAQGLVTVAVYGAVMFAPLGNRMTLRRPTMSPPPSNP